MELPKINQTNSQENLSSLKKSFASTRQIPSYIKIYGRQLSKTPVSRSARMFKPSREKSPENLNILTPGTSVCSSLTQGLPNIRKIALLTPKLYPPSTLNVTTPEQQRAKQQKLIESTDYSINKAKSDKVELFRDLVQYEYEFIRQSQLPSRFEVIAAKAKQIQEATQSSQELRNEDIRWKILQGMQQISNIDSNLSAPTFNNIIHENPGWIDINDEYNMKKLFAGVEKVSGIPWLIKIEGNFLLKAFSIDLITMNGEHFVLPIECEENELEISQHIMKHMYFTMNDFELKLNYDQRHNDLFQTLIVHIKGLGLNCVVITQEEAWITITITTPMVELRVPKSLLTRQHRIFAEKTSKIVSKIREKVMFREDIGLTWLNSSNPDPFFERVS